MSENYLKIFRNSDGSFIGGDPRLGDTKKQIQFNNKFVDLNKFPTQQQLKSNQTDFRGWVNELLKVSDNDQIDPVLKPIKGADGKYYNEDGSEYNPEFDYQKFLPPYEQFSNVGDPRYSLGSALASVTATFVPRQILYMDIVQAGGCQIINNYICDSDANPIVSVETTCSPEILAKNYDFINTIGNVPLTLENIEVKPDEIMEHIYNSYTEHVTKDVLAFKEYITKNYLNLNYSIRLLEIIDFPLYTYVELKKENFPTVYLNYYHQDKDELSSLLNIPIVKVPIQDSLSFISISQKSVPRYDV